MVLEVGRPRVIHDLNLVANEVSNLEEKSPFSRQRYFYHLSSKEDTRTHTRFFGIPQRGRRISEIDGPRNPFLSRQLSALFLQKDTFLQARKPFRFKATEGSAYILCLAHLPRASLFRSSRYSLLNPRSTTAFRVAKSR